MSTDLMTSETQRSDLVRRGRCLEYFTIVWNVLEGIVSVAAGLLGERDSQRCLIPWPTESLTAIDSFSYS